MALDLKSIDQEAADCCAAWAQMPDATAGLHIHHEIIAEDLSEPIEHRISYILREKPKPEQALRLRLMRPIQQSALAEYNRIQQSAWAEYNRIRQSASAELHAGCTPDCPWDGKTIFPREAR